MRWFFVDTVTAFEPWRSISGRKAVSLEEYYLLEPLGREGVLPEGLVVECFVEMARWLVLASSSFEQAALLCEIVRFEANREVTMGDLLDVQVGVDERTDRMVTVHCAAASAGILMASGLLRMELVPATETLDADGAEESWRGLYATS